MPDSTMAGITLHEDLLAFARSARVTSSSTYVVAGSRRDVSTESSDVSGKAEDAERLRAGLETELYQRLYARGGAPSTRPVDVLQIRQHLARLSRAHSGVGPWEPGWRRIRERPDGWVEVEKDGLTYRVPPQDLRTGSGELVAETACRVRLPKELRYLVAGFYVALGDTLDAEEGGLRLYWHLRADGAVPWLRLLTERLHRRQAPFRLKVLSDPQAYRRADAGVLYLEASRLDSVRDELVGVADELRELLRPEVPRLTLPLAPGVGLAESPAEGGSFGEDRCGRIAEGLIRGFERGASNAEERLEAILEVFREAGLDPERPYLEPGSEASYEVWPRGGGGSGPPRLEKGELEGDFQARGRPSPGGREGWAGRGDGGEGSSRFLDAAHRIGDRLCRQAIWHQERCNWMGRASGEKNPKTGTLTPAIESLDGSLYRGTAGVGLFLARLFAATSVADHRRTARGALRQALAAVERAQGEEDPFGLHHPLALYGGDLGVVWAALRAAEWIDDPELAALAERRLDRLLADLTDSNDEHLLDLIRGNAGSILALLDLRRRARPGGGERLLAAATTLGEEICAVADRGPDCWTWSSLRSTGFGAEDPPLAGLSHGAAGIGLALFELAAVRGDEGWRHAGRQAFAYEDGVFDPERGNWPDLRVHPSASAPGFIAFWCHGAPGIVLARLRAMALDPARADRYREAARAGLEATRRALEERLAEPDADTTPCHGLTGLIEVLLLASQALKDPRDRVRADAAMDRLLELHGPDRPWPSGVASRGPNPSLMLGDAGVGYALLRLDQPAGVPPVLLPGA